MRFFSFSELATVAAWKRKGLAGARLTLFATALGAGGGLVFAQKATPLPSDSESPRLDLLPVNMQPQHLVLHPSAMSPASVNPQDYIISPDDELNVDVVDVPELTRSCRVSPTGVITLPLLSSPVQAMGLTLAQLSQKLEDQLQAEGLVSHPHVTVTVGKSRLHAIAIAGAVKKPQMYEFFGRTTVLDALSQAEGLADDAGSTAIVTRGDIGSKLASARPAAIQADSSASSPGVIKIDLKRLLEDGDATQNLELFPGDRITVQRAGIIYVVGAVAKPGGFILKDDRQQMTILKALALAEYTKTTAALKRTIIVRQSVKNSGVNQEIPVELDKILDGRAKDRVLLANDILFIPESRTRVALGRAAEALAQGASLLFYRVP